MVKTKDMRRGKQEPTTHFILMMVLLMMVLFGHSVEPFVNKNQFSEKAFILQNGDQVPKHQLVRYLTENILSVETKVKEFDINKTIFYSHVYDAHDLSNNELSMVAINSRGAFLGANLVLKQSRIRKMYAPDIIDKILMFLLSCYDESKPSGITDNDGYVSILRVSENPVVNKILLKNTWRKISAKALLEDRAVYHLVWEINNTEVDNLLTSLGYERLGCGKERPKCDWTAIGMEPELAERQCLYRVQINTKGPIIYQETDETL